MSLGLRIIKSHDAPRIARTQSLRELGEHSEKTLHRRQPKSAMITLASFIVLHSAIEDYDALDFFSEADHETSLVGDLHSVFPQ
jgi:hypothetical protein